MDLNSNHDYFNEHLHAGLNASEVDDIFLKMTEIYSPDVVLEIGSRDFLDSLKIKKISPDSKVFAFEANPENFSENLKNIDQMIFPLPIALGNLNQITKIIVPQFASRLNNATQQQRGIGSVLTRPELGEAIEYEVPMLRLDAFMNQFNSHCSNFSMWIDVEGYAYQVLCGASESLLKKCLFIKVEVEDIAYWEGQYLSSDVRRFLASHNFFEYANCDKGLKQYDIFFINKNITKTESFNYEKSL